MFELVNEFLFKNFFFQFTKLYQEVIILCKRKYSCNLTMFLGSTTVRTSFFIYFTSYIVNRIL